MNTNETVMKITKLVESEFREIFKNKLISLILYGSYARGDNEGDSDIDIIAIIDMDKTDLMKFRRTVSNFANKLDLEYDVLISIKLQDKETFEKWKNTLPFFRNIQEEGVIICA
jgi:uncharacterized protein